MCVSDILLVCASKIVCVVFCCLHVFVCLFDTQSVRLCLSVGQPVIQSENQKGSLSVCLPVCLSVCLLECRKRLNMF